MVEVIGKVKLELSFIWPKNTVRKTGAATPAPGNFNAVLSPIHCGLKGAILDLEKNKWMGNFLFIL